MGATFNPRIYIADFGVQNWFFGQFFGRWRWWTRLASIHVLPVSNVSNVSHVSNVSYPLIYPMPNEYNPRKFVLYCIFVIVSFDTTKNSNGVGIDWLVIWATQMIGFFLVVVQPLVIWSGATQTVVQQRPLLLLNRLLRLSRLFCYHDAPEKWQWQWWSAASEWLQLDLTDKRSVIQSGWWWSGCSGCSALKPSTPATRTCGRRRSQWRRRQVDGKAGVAECYGFIFETLPEAQRTQGVESITQIITHGK